ncbi:MAG: glycosyltransferase [Methanobacteriota archaeon]|nr:MAG: glycosyltransferase [Euryarchaeota archaeon]
MKLSIKQIVFLNSHPIQYFAPLYQYLSEHGLPIEVWYCSDESIRGAKDPGFQTQVKWDIPLLSGYSFRFLKNHSPLPGVSRGFWGLINLEVLHLLKTQPPSLIIVHGWNYFTNLLTLNLSKRYSHFVGLRGESPYNQEQNKSFFKKHVKQMVLKYWLFQKIDFFFFIGQQNKEFYKSLKVPERKLKFTPYCVDNHRFQKETEKLIPRKFRLRKELGIPERAYVILYVGKLINKKRPMDLIRAFELSNITNKYLLMVGDGPLREKIERRLMEKKLVNVSITGFINQSELPKYYSVADVLVLCSGIGETWGLVVNEAMNFGLPIIISDMPGSAYDLVEHGKNGYRFQTGDIDQLAHYLEQSRSLDRTVVRKINHALLKVFDYHTTFNTLHDLLAENSTII